MVGNKKVERYMEPVWEAIKKYIEKPTQTVSDIYNPAYGAVMKAIQDHEAIVKELVEALEASFKAIGTLNEDALGMGTKEDGHGGIDYWPFKNELLHQIYTALAKAKEVC